MPEDDAFRLGKIQKLAMAVAKAEGYGVEGALPTRINNPGDLELGDVGCGVEQGKTIYPNAKAGWDALERQCALILTDKSPYYQTQMTIMQFAMKYTGNDEAAAWAKTVADFLGLLTTNTLRAYSAAP